MTNNYLHIFTFLLLSFFFESNAQEFRIFSLSDFDLKDSVKTCLVITNYGKEEYEFNKKGLLTKSVTRYNENDYDVTYYKYDGDELLEKRSESYRDNIFDPSTSIANFYEIDSVPNRRITEKIVSYEKEFLEQYVYEFNNNGKLAKMTRSNSDGTDVTLVDYKKYKGETTTTYLMNNVPLKSVRTSSRKGKDGVMKKVVLTKEFLKGEENMAFEEVFGPEGKLLAQQEFEFNKEEKSFVPTTRTTFKYDANGMLIEEISKTGDIIEKKEYIYQYDKGEGGNWIKQIITPDNTYKTRRITYYESESVVENKD
jgi:hypothetical protein